MLLLWRALTLATLALTPSLFAQASPADLPACTLQGRNYLCSKPNAQHALAITRTVALISQPANHASDAALASLARSLNKSVVAGTDSQPADLTFRLTPIEPAGVSVGMGTVDLAMLNIFLATPADRTHTLLWSETYNGDPNMPWPSVVNALMRQCRSHLGIR